SLAAVAASRRPCPLRMYPSSSRTTIGWSGPSSMIAWASNAISAGGGGRGVPGEGLILPSGPSSGRMAGMSRLAFRLCDFFATLCLPQCVQELGQPCPRPADVTPIPDHHPVGGLQEGRYGPGIGPRSADRPQVGKRAGGAENVPLELPE